MPPTYTVRVTDRTVDPEKTVAWTGCNPERRDSIVHNLEKEVRRECRTTRNNYLVTTRWTNRGAYRVYRGTDPDVPLAICEWTEETTEGIPALPLRPEDEPTEYTTRS